MKTIVCGAHMPFMRGGAELHMENLVAALVKQGHECELVRVPVAWDRGRLFDAPLAWRMVPLDADVVIATNFPSYFVRHPRKVVWLFHQHRAAYDAADAAWSDFFSDAASLEDQRLLASWDCAVLGEARRVFATSRSVADRVRRFNGIAPTPLYHPPPLHDRLHPGPFEDFVFAPMRLERNKRPDLVVDAAEALPAGMRAVLTGPGSMERTLRQRASRLTEPTSVQFLGFVDDATLVDRFARALAVVYPPFEEDYGYVTLQAFLAGKPVITTRDSGGVLEWVEDGVTGLVTDPDGAAIAAAVARLHADRELARRLGAAGRRRAQALDWDSVVRTLLGEPGSPARAA